MALRLDYTNMLAENVPGGIPLAALESGGDAFARAMAVFDERRGRGELGFLDLPAATANTDQILQFSEGAGPSGGTSSGTRRATISPACTCSRMWTR